MRFRHTNGGKLAVQENSRTRFIDFVTLAKKRKMKPALYLLFPFIFLACQPSPSTNSAQTTLPNDSSQSEKETASTKPMYTILSERQVGRITNYNLLIQPGDTSLMHLSQIITDFKAEKCGSAQCNVIGLWDDQKAFELYDHQQQDSGWRKKNWVFVCEHFVADYNATVGELGLFTFMDSAYREVGGKKKRPVDHSFDF